MNPTSSTYLETCWNRCTPWFSYWLWTLGLIRSRAMPLIQHFQQMGKPTFPTVFSSCFSLALVFSSSGISLPRSSLEIWFCYFLWWLQFTSERIGDGQKGWDWESHTEPWLMHFNAFKLLVYIRVITRARQRATSLQYTGFVSRAKNLPYRYCRLYYDIYLI